MSTFKVGDEVIDNDGCLAEVIAVKGDYIKLNWKVDSISNEEAINNNFWNSSNFTIVKQKSSNPFIKTVIETRLVSAYHELPNGLELFVEPRKDEVKIDLERGTWNKQSLAELAQILSEIAEAM